jgi:hypothetical protein
MKLSLTERFEAMNLLPQEGNFLTLRLVREARETLAPSELELKRIEASFEGDQLRYNMVAAGKLPEIDVQLGDIMQSAIKAKLVELDKANKLTENLFSLYEKFIT